MLSLIGLERDGSDMGETQAIKETREEEEDLPEPPKLRFLRRMVVALTATLMVGVLAIAAAIVITVSREPAPAAFFAGGDLAAEITLPAGEQLISAAVAGGVLTVATKAKDGTETLRLFDIETGEALGATLVVRD